MQRNLRFLISRTESNLLSRGTFNNSHPLLVNRFVCCHKCQNVKLSSYKSIPPTYLSQTDAELLESKTKTFVDRKQEKWQHSENVADAHVSEIFASSESDSTFDEFVSEKHENVDLNSSIDDIAVNDESVFDRLFQLNTVNSPLEAPVQNPSKNQVDDNNPLPDTSQHLVHENDTKPSDSPPRFPSDANDIESWLVSGSDVPSIVGLDDVDMRSLILTNFPNGRYKLDSKIDKCFARDLYSRDYATLATSVYNCDLYRSLDFVFLVLQISPGGISRIDPETQSNHLRALVENIVEKFEPKFLVLCSPIIPRKVDAFLGQSEEEVQTESLKVIEVITNFCNNNRVMENSNIVHYSLDNAFKVNGSIQHSLFFNPNNDFQLSFFGSSFLSSILSMVSRSLMPNPKDAFVDSSRNVRLTGRTHNLNYNEFRNENYGGRGESYHGQRPRHFRNDNVRAPFNPNRGSGTSRYGRKFYNNEIYSEETKDEVEGILNQPWNRRGQSEDEQTLYDYQPQPSHGSRNRSFRNFERDPYDRRSYQENRGFSQRGGYRPPEQSAPWNRNENVKYDGYESNYRGNQRSYDNERRYDGSDVFNNNARSKSVDELGKIKAYKPGREFVYKRPDGGLSGFTGKFKTDKFDNERASRKPRVPYKLNYDNDDSYEFIDLDEIEKNE